MHTVHGHTCGQNIRTQKINLRKNKAIMRDQRHRTVNTFLTEKSEMEDWHSPSSRFTTENNSKVGGALRKADQQINGTGHSVNQIPVNIVTEPLQRRRAR